MKTLRRLVITVPYRFIVMIKSPRKEFNYNSGEIMIYKLTRRRIRMEWALKAHFYYLPRSKVVGIGEWD